MSKTAVAFLLCAIAVLAMSAFQLGINYAEQKRGDYGPTLGDGVCAYGRDGHYYVWRERDDGTCYIVDAPADLMKDMK